jgi:hypothetical protein
VGLWDVDGVSSNNSSSSGTSKDNAGIVSLFRVHSRPICCLEWLNNENMVTSSYDGSIRRLNVETGTFEEIFATYDDSDTTYPKDLGYDLDQGYRYWTQDVTVDHRYKGSSNPCLFVSTSVGDVFHVDLRVSEKQKITFYETVSEKKINTVRYVYFRYQTSYEGVGVAVVNAFIIESQIHRQLTISKWFMCIHSCLVLRLWITEAFIQTEQP